MGTLVTNSDGLQVHYGTRDVEVNYARAVGGVDSVQQVVFDIKGTSLGTTVTIQAGQAFIPANSLIKSATLLVKEGFTSGGSATLTVGTYSIAGAAVDADGIDATVAVAGLGANVDIACDGAQVGAIVTADCYIGAIYGTAAFTAGTARLVVEYIQNRG
ncbi:MAG: hypothetical protein AB7I96_09230 [Candidatus Dadabacteria bacterium]